MGGRLGEDRLREGSPVGLPLCRHVENTAQGWIARPRDEVAGHRQHGVSDVEGRGRAAGLVADDGDLAPLLAQAQHGAHEVAAEGRIDPGGTQDGMVGRRSRHGLLAGELATAIGGYRARRVLLAIRQQ